MTRSATAGAGARRRCCWRVVARLPAAVRTCTTRRATTRSRRSAFFTNGAASRPLVANTVARGQLREDEHLYTGIVNGQPADDVPDAGDRGADGARSGALQRVLFAVSRPYRRGQRHDRSARIPSAAVVPRGAAAQRAGRLLLRCDDQRVRRDAGLRGAGAGRGSLGDRGLHPRAAAQSARDGRRRAGRSPWRSRSSRRTASPRARQAQEAHYVDADLHPPAADIDAPPLARAHRRRRRAGASAPSASCVDPEQFFARG